MAGLSRPQLFQSYILGSSSLWFNEFYLSTELDALTAGQLQDVKKVYLSVGENEDWYMLKSFDPLRSAFRHQGFDEQRFQAEIIGGSGHVGAMQVSLYNGLRFVFPST